MRLVVWLALLTLLGSLAGCAAAPALAGRQFLSVGVTDRGADRPLVAGTRIRLSFTATDLSASAGCNTIGGAYRIDAGRLIMDAIATTEIGCPADLGAQDAWLAAFLGAKPTVNLGGNELALASGTVVVKLLDRTVADPDRPLVGPTWTVDSIISGDAVSSVPQGATATLVFNANGTLTIFAGCNQGGATWTKAGSGIQVSDLVLTKKACVGSANELESTVVAVLHAGTMALTIEAGSMTLQAGANGLQLRAP